MPRISEFYGITIGMYYDDHAPPHFHADYAEHSAKIAIAGGEVIAGRLPRRALRLVREWAQAHRSELWTNWARVQRGEQPDRIAPLR